MFQSLLSWIGFRDPSTVSRPDPVDQFQSLLSWIGFRDELRNWTFKPHSLSFNPCCRGLGSETAQRSLSLPRQVPGFNPCCRGLGSETKTTGRPDGLQNGVSILVVVDWVQRRGEALLVKWNVGSFNPCCRGLGSETWSEYEQASPSDIGFNPCCRGLGSETGAVCSDGWSRTSVSILVVVDWVQRQSSSL